MIENAAMLSTSPPLFPSRRSVLAAGASAILGGCAVPGGTIAPPPPVPPARQDGAFVMPDGIRLPFRTWLPEGAPTAAVLALHGFNDSRDAWEVSAPILTKAGFAIYGPDQRGFGDTPTRGRWAGTDRMVADAAEMARQVARRHPGARLVLLGESMGAAVLICLATSGLAPAGARYVLAAPAVWGRATMNVFLRVSLWAASTVLPGMAVSGAPVRVMASDNRDAIVRLSRDPLTIHDTRFDTLRGLVNLEDAASAAAAAFTADGLFLYGGRDELIPKDSMAATWRALPPGGARTAYYPNAYHLLLRDHARAVALADIIAWARDPAAPLPSGADREAAMWLATRA
jgi:alpha-beta hydrolase superfamily lysophospholipase